MEALAESSSAHTTTASEPIAVNLKRRCKQRAGPPSSNYSQPAEVNLACKYALARFGIGIDGGQSHAICADFLDLHLCLAVAIDILCPVDVEIDCIT